MTTPLRTVIRARISSDPGQNLSGVARQVRAGLAAVEANPLRVLATDVPGSPVFRRRRNRRRGEDPKADRSLAELDGLIAAGPAGPHWLNGIIVDNDRSAATKADGTRPNLPEYDRMIGLLLDSTIAAIWASSLDRIWRSPLEYYELVERKLNRRHAWIDTDQNNSRDLADPDTEFIVGFLTAYARAEVMKTRQRVNSQMADYAAKGAAHGKAPVGLAPMHKQPDGGMHAPQASESGACPACEGRKTGEWRTYRPVPEETPALTDAARRAIGGEPGENLEDLAVRVLEGDPGLHPESLYSILRVLDSVWKLPTREGLTWAESGVTTLHDTLLNHAYTGRRATTKGWTGHGHRPESGTVVSDGENWPAVWSPKVRDALLLTLTSEKITVTMRDGTTRERQRNPNDWPGRARPKHVFTGLAECWCGLPAYVQGNRGRARYTCKAVGRGEGVKGEGHAVRAKADVEAEGYRRILFWMREGGLYDQARRAVQPGEVRQLHDELDTALAERKGLLHNGRLLGMTDAEITAEGAELRGKIDNLQARLADAERNITQGSLPSGAGFAAMWDDADLAERQRIAALLISKIVIYQAPKRGGKPADARFILPWPAAWAKGLPNPADADPLPPPGTEEETSRGMARSFLLALPPGELATAEEVAARCGFPVYTARVALGKLLAAGEAERELIRLAGSTAADGSARGLECYGWRAGNGSPLGDRSPDAPGKALAYLRALPAGELATVADVAAGAGIAFRTAQRVLGELLTAGEVAREKGRASGDGNGRRGRPSYEWRAAA